MRESRPIYKIDLAAKPHKQLQYHRKEEDAIPTYIGTVPLFTNKTLRETKLKENVIRRKKKKTLDVGPDNMIDLLLKNGIRQVRSENVSTLVYYLMEKDVLSERVIQCIERRLALICNQISSYDLTFLFKFVCEAKAYTLSYESLETITDTMRYNLDYDRFCQSDVFVCLSQYAKLKYKPNLSDVYQAFTQWMDRHMMDCIPDHLLFAVQYYSELHLTSPSHLPFWNVVAKYISERSYDLSKIHVVSLIDSLRDIQNAEVVAISNHLMNVVLPAQLSISETQQFVPVSDSSSCSHPDNMISVKEAPPFEGKSLKTLRSFQPTTSNFTPKKQCLTGDAKVKMFIKLAALLSDSPKSPVEAHFDQFMTSNHSHWNILTPWLIPADRLKYILANLPMRYFVKLVKECGIYHGGLLYKATTTPSQTRMPVVHKEIRSATRDEAHSYTIFLIRQLDINMPKLTSGHRCICIQSIGRMLSAGVIKPSDISTEFIIELLKGVKLRDMTVYDYVVLINGLSLVKKHHIHSSQFDLLSSTYLPAVDDVMSRRGFTVQEMMMIDKALEEWECTVL